MRELTKLRLIYFIRFMGDASFYPFFSLYLASKGMNGGQLGILLSIIPFLSIVMNLCWNYLSKDANMNRNIIKIIVIIEAIAIILVTRVSGFELFFILTVLIAVAGSPYYSLLDGFAATFSNKNHIEYAKIRMYGSSGFVLATTMAGFIVYFTKNYEYSFYISGSLFILSSFLMTLVKPIDLGDANKTVKMKKDYKALYTNIQFYKYILYYVICLGSVTIGDSFYGIYLKSRGITDLQYGFVLSLTVTFEVILLSVMNRYGYKIKEYYIYVLASAFVVIRFFVFGSNLPLIFSLVIVILRGTSWGMILYIHFKYFIKLVKVENITMAILTLAMVNNIYIGIGNIISGRVYTKYGFSTFYIGISILALIGTLFFAFFTPKIKEE